MSTAEQVARAFIGADALAGIGYEHDLEVATKAIEFDRAVHDGVEVSVIPRSAMTTPEGVTYWPIFQWEAARGDVHHVSLPLGSSVGTGSRWCVCRGVRS